MAMFTTPLAIVYICGSVAMTILYFGLVIALNVGFPVTFQAVGYGYYISAAILILLFALTALAVIVLFIRRLQHNDNSELKLVCSCTSSAFQFHRTNIAQKLGMAVTFAVVLIVAGSLILASLFVAQTQQNADGIGVSVELLSQISIILALVTFSSFSSSKGGVPDTAASRSAWPSSANTNTASHIMEIDD
jgi:hypothetical protein